MSVKDITICVLAFIGSIVFLACAVWSVFKSTKIYKNYYDEIHNKNQHIIKRCTKDPINAIFLVRKWIIDRCHYAKDFNMWEDNAYAMMLTWLNCEEALELGIHDPRYISGILSDKQCEHKWIQCFINTSTRPTLNVIIDLAVGITYVKCQGGDSITIRDEAVDLEYIISQAQPDYLRYISMEILRTPTYTLM